MQVVGLGNKGEAQKKFNRQNVLQENIIVTRIGCRDTCYHLIPPQNAGQDNRKVDETVDIGVWMATP